LSVKEASLLALIAQYPYTDNFNAKLILSFQNKSAQNIGNAILDLSFKCSEEERISADGFNRWAKSLKKRISKRIAPPRK